MTNDVPIGQHRHAHQQERKRLGHRQIVTIHIVVGPTIRAARARRPLSTLPGMLDTVCTLTGHALSLPPAAPGYLRG